MKSVGIILAGGLGKRLRPITTVMSKQLLPVYDKPMIFYPLTTLMLASIKNIIIITNPNDRKIFKDLIGNGSNWGINITYLIQEKPNGLPEAFKICREYIKKSFVTLILGDNIFYGSNFINLLRNSVINHKSSIFTYKVNDPTRYGVVNYVKGGKIQIEEKPLKPKSNLAITGIYCFTSNVLNFVSKLKPSKRGETEIVDLIKLYCSTNELQVIELGRGDAWLDTGTFDSLIEAAHFIQILERRQGLKISVPDEIAFRMKFISKSQLTNNINNYKKNNINFYNYLTHLKYD